MSTDEHATNISVPVAQENPSGQETTAIDQQTDDHFTVGFKRAFDEIHGLLSNIQGEIRNLRSRVDTHETLLPNPRTVLQNVATPTPSSAPRAVDLGPEATSRIKSRDNSIAEAIMNLSLYEKTHKTGYFIPLDNLAKELTDNPSVFQGLLIGAKDHEIGMILIWELGSFDDTSKTFKVHQVEGEKSGSITIPTVKSAWALTAEQMKVKYTLNNPDVNSSSGPASSFVPFPFNRESITALGIRMNWDHDSQKIVYQFVDMDDLVLNEFSISPTSSRGGKRDSTDLSSSSTGHSKNIQLSQPALAHMGKTNAQIRDLTGTSVLQFMMYQLSLAERESGVLATQCAKYSAACLDTAQGILDWVCRDLSDWRTVTEGQALANQTTKKSQTLPTDKSPLPNSTDVMEAWDNYVIALVRTFEIKGPLYKALSNISTQMYRFLQKNSNIYPELKTNGFSLMYLNLLIQDFLMVMRNPYNTSADIEELISRLVVNEKTEYYRIAFDRVSRKRLENIEKKLPSSHGGNRTNNSGSNNNSSSSGSNKSKKSTTPCYRMFTTKGCQFGNRCRFNHDVTTLTSDQKKTAKEQYTKWNKQYPNETPFVADEAKF